MAIIQTFNERCALMFFKGALLKDPDGLLNRPGENSHVVRRMLFSGVSEVVEMEGHLRALLPGQLDDRGLMHERSGELGPIARRWLIETAYIDMKRR